MNTQDYHPSYDTADFQISDTFTDILFQDDPLTYTGNQSGFPNDHFYQPPGILEQCRCQAITKLRDNFGSSKSDVVQRRIIDMINQCRYLASKKGMDKRQLIVSIRQDELQGKRYAYIQEFQEAQAAPLCSCCRKQKDPATMPPPPGPPPPGLINGPLIFDPSAHQHYAVMHPEDEDSFYGPMTMGMGDGRGSMYESHPHPHHHHHVIKEALFDHNDLTMTPGFYPHPHHPVAMTQTLKEDPQNDNTSSCNGQQEEERPTSSRPPTRRGPSAVGKSENLMDEMKLDVFENSDEESDFDPSEKVDSRNVNRLPSASGVMVPEKDACSKSSRVTSSNANSKGTPEPRTHNLNIDTDFEGNPYNSRGKDGQKITQPDPKNPPEIKDEVINTGSMSGRSRMSDPDVEDQTDDEEEAGYDSDIDAKEAIINTARAKACMAFMQMQKRNAARTGEIRPPLANNEMDDYDKYLFETGLDSD